MVINHLLNEMILQADTTCEVDLFHVVGFEFSIPTNDWNLEVVEISAKLGHSFILWICIGNKKKVASFLWNVMYPKDPCRLYELYVLPYMNG